MFTWIKLWISRYNGKYKLTILGTEKSWYFPGGAVLFVVTLKDVEVK